MLFHVPGHAVLAEIGRGAAGIVYRARQGQPAREVALKMLRPHESGSAESLARFRLEAAAVASLDHPVILPVYTVGEHERLPYFTMKLCCGSLADRIGAWRGRWRETAELVAVLAGAVHHAHARGVLHRDLKPGNVLFDEDDRPYIGDFGLAKLLQRPTGSGPATRPLLVMGTPGYLAPEVLQAGAAGATTGADVFALGAVLHELLTGAPPPAEGAAAAARVGVPRDLAIICAHALAADPGRRYASAEALAADLRAWLAGRPITARSVSAFGRGWAWVRRNPALAAVAAGLFLTLAGSAVMVAGKNRALARALADALAAEARSQASLAESLVAQATAVRQSGREGQQREALALITRAAGIQRTAAMYDEATAALLLPDWGLPDRPRPWTGDANAAVPTPDFTHCLVEAVSQEISLRPVAGGPPRWTWTAPALSAAWPVFSPDGRWVALHLRNDEIHVLAVADGRPALRLTGRPYAFKGAVWMFGKDLDFSPDGSLLAVARPEGGVSFHRPEGGGEVRSWPGPAVITTMQFSPDGTRLAVGGGRDLKDSLLAVIDVATAQVLVQEKTPRRVEFTAWSDDARCLAFRSAGGSAEVRFAQNLKVRSVLPDREALHGKFLPDGDRLLLTQQTGATRLWEIDGAHLLVRKDDDGRPGVWWSRPPLRQWRAYFAGPAIVVPFLDSPVRRTWRADEGNYSVPEHGWSADLTPDGRFLAVGGWGGGVVWNLASGRRALRVDLTDESNAGALRFDPDGGGVWFSVINRGLWWSPVPDPTAESWSRGPAQQIDPEPGFYLTASNRPAGRLALINPTAGQVKVFDTRARRLVARWPHAGANTAEFAPDGARLVVNGVTVGPQPGAPATVYEASTGTVVRVLGSEAGRLARWSRGGAWIMAVDGKKRAALWRTDTWAPGPPLPEEAQSWQSACAFSADDRWMLLRSTENFQLFELATGRTIIRLNAPEGGSLRMDLGLDGDRSFWTVGMDGRVEVWDLAAARRALAAAGLPELPAR